MTNGGSTAAPLGAATPAPSGGAKPALRRTLSLTHVVLYGLGVTIGAGIYVLIGAAASRAGMHAPLAFLIASILMALTAASFAELGSRLPVAAGEAAYIRAGFRSDHLATAAGLIVVAIAVVSAAAISVGSAGYILLVLPLPEPLIIAMLVAAMTALAMWGIKESVTFAAVMTVIEIGGLMIIVVAGFLSGPAVFTRLPEIVPVALDSAHAAGLMAATLLAVFAFIGFESLSNIAEEMKDPQRNLPLAIGLTLIATTVIYMLVVWVALVAVGPTALASSRAPLTLVFVELTGLSPRIMTVIAIIATLNGIIVQIIMASRVLYGLANQGSLPAPLAGISPATGTPLLATVLSGAAVLAFAVMLPLDRLAEWTARLTLILFGLVNAALILLRRRETAHPAGILRVPGWVPWAAIVAIAAVLASELLAPSSGNG